MLRLECSNFLGRWLHEEHDKTVDGFSFGLGADSHGGGCSNDESASEKNTARIGQEVSPVQEASGLLTSWLRLRVALCVFWRPPRAYRVFHGRLSVRHAGDAR